MITQLHQRRILLPNFNYLNLEGKLLYELIKKVSPTKVSTLNKMPSDQNIPVSYTADKALCCVFEKLLTKNQCIGLRLDAVKCNIDIYPMYNSVLKFKKGVTLKAVWF